MKKRASTAQFPGFSIKFLLITAVVLLVGMFLPAVSRVYAQDSTLDMQVTAAFDGYFKYGEWLPLMVELSNQGSNLDGTIRTQVTGSQGLMVFETPVSLPSGSRKRIPLYVLPNNFSRELDVRLVSNERVVASQKATVRPQPNISYFTGIIAPERGALALLNGVRFPGQERPKIIVDLTIEDLPGRAEGLRAFDLLIINDTDTSTMTPEQGAALASWIQQGGRLVIGGGAGFQRTIAGLPENILSVTFTGSIEMKSTDLHPLAAYAGGDPIKVSGPFVASMIEPKNSRVLAGSPDAALLIEHAFGSGAVNISALDLAGVPFNGWPGTQAFWQSLIGPGGRFPDNMPFDVSPRQWQANTLSYALSNIPSLDLPSITSVSILLLVYVLIVGPVNYLVLRWRKRMHWGWITIPALTLIFTAAAFGIGYGLRGNDLILNKISLVEMHLDGDDASLISFMGLFSPRMQSYEVAVEGESLISPITGYSPGPWIEGTAAGGEMVMVQGEPSRVKGLTVNQWAMQSFMAEGTWHDFGSFSGDLRIEQNTLIGKIRNDTSYPITDVVVTIQSRFARLGDMAPGEEKEVNIALSNLQSDRFGAPLSYRLYQENAPGGQITRAMEQKSNILSSLLDNSSWSKFSSTMPASQGTGVQGNIIVFGWLDQAPPQVSVPDSRLTQKTTALVYMYMQYELPGKGDLSIPPGLIPGTITKLPMNGGSCGNQTAVYMGQGQGQAEFEFTLPSDIQGIQVNTLQLALWNDSGNPAAIPAAAIYNWEDEEWIGIKDPIQGTNVIEDGAPYINDNGVIRIQLSSEAESFGCIYVDLGMQASAPEAQGG